MVKPIALSNKASNSAFLKRAKFELPALALASNGERKLSGSPLSPDQPKIPAVNSPALARF